MRKDQFIEAANDYYKRSMFALIVLMLVVIASVSAYEPFHHRVETYLDSRFAGPTSDILAIIPMALPVISAFCLIMPFSRRIERKLGLACPHCGKALAPYKGIVIASKNCPIVERKCSTIIRSVMSDATALNNSPARPARSQLGGSVRGMIVRGITSIHGLFFIPLTIIPLTIFRPTSPDSKCQSTAQ